MAETTPGCMAALPPDPPREAARDDADTVTLRWLDLDTIAAHAWPDLARPLDNGEQARAARFHFERDRRAFIAAHALLRATLSRRAVPQPEAWRFVAGPHGRPEIEAGGDGLRFNLSHTQGMVAVAVTRLHDVGVDVERADPPRLGPHITNRFFAPAERDYLQSLPPEEWMDAAYAFWTLKEAYIKAIGLGLACPLDAFHFILEPLSVRFSPRIADDPSCWRLYRHRPTPAHVLALAVRHGDPASLRIDARAAGREDLPLQLPPRGAG